VLIFDDANLTQAADAIAALKWRHAGQACITVNRIYVQRGVYEKFVEIMRERGSKLVVGHGAEPKTTMGPLTTPRGVDKAAEMVADARKKGARILLGGNRLDIGGGYFFEPTVVADAHDDLLLAREEQFAPIAALFPFDTEDEAVNKANDTSVSLLFSPATCRGRRLANIFQMGLASYFFTKDVDRTWRLLENLEAGMIGMNTGNQSAAETPFGGIKMSGYGKESGKDVAIEEYLITKTGTLTVDGL
jgi:succinate-semialdehyde dehydrogenase/glutarate-semialdehyde dehydrogenase